MFEYLEGKITLVEPAFIVLDVHGVGYKLYSPSPLNYQLGQAAKVFVEQIFSDNAGMRLYGFASQADKRLFLKLLSVSGIGPKSALAIMAAENTESLASAIENGQVKYLTQFPGIGKKTASQIVLDLKGKLKDFTPKSDKSSPALEDALLALLALGYTKREVEKLKPKLSKLPEMTADAYIKQGLALLLKK
ncbi:MAG: Holliday junction branch migration protein RuvA [Lactobacillus sp.]|jgi:Holliday junction DNA helicase RuvA|nr:Holliday junction branch migration protein RuvA [Lactobacillus sp.]MCH3905966.1 Holliday junction branch migration protein RuvA [Lactobacillus sp.]MCH3990460.1 Holliday junction branch migration protein RuvA [Lactobacillus sp.]MCH4068825.1 Holliday junction branch migration protein RuvA [Lactobacillus sp.]MCI1304450.1 Holliday junction branch migration protein RuvA [Lactobacillus sp.]